MSSAKIEPSPERDDEDVLLADPTGPLRLALDDHVEAVRADPPGGLWRPRPRRRTSSPCSAIQASLSSGRPANSGTCRRQSRARAVSAPSPPQTSLKYWWTNWTAIEPSPTAEAQRLIEPCRTSPATKMPGTLVSSRNGSRSGRHPFGRLAVLREVRPRQDKAALVPLHEAVEPARRRRRPDKDEQRVRRDRLGLAGRGVLYRDLLQVLVARRLDDAAARAEHLDVVPVLDLLDQVLGHALADVVRPAEKDDLARAMVREEHRRLPGRVGPADDVYVLVVARERLGLRGAVVDAAAGELL